MPRTCAPCCCLRRFRPEFSAVNGFDGFTAKTLRALRTIIEPFRIKSVDRTLPIGVEPISTEPNARST
jgi:hypothetical protein